MAYDAASGMWKPEETGNTTAEKVTGMLKAGNPYVEQAKSAGMDVANTRGVLNSSIAAGASQKAAYDAVVPIATADASIAAQKDLSKQSYVQNDALTGKQIASTETIADKSNQKDFTIADMNVASNKQDKAATAAQNYANIYSTMVNTINNNKDIPADARATMLSNAKTMYDNNLSLVTQIYNVQLDWGAASAAGAGASAAAPAYTSSPTPGSSMLGANGQLPPGYFATGNGTYTDGINVVDNKGRYLGPASAAVGQPVDFYQSPTNTPNNYDTN